MNNPNWLLFQREIISYGLTILFTIIIFCWIAQPLISLFKGWIEKLFSKNSKSISQNEKELSNQIPEILIFILITIISLIANKDWIYAIYIFVLGPRIASEGYLIGIIKAWKTTRKEESVENVTVTKEATISKQKIKS